MKNNEIMKNIKELLNGVSYDNLKDMLKRMGMRTNHDKSRIETINYVINLIKDKKNERIVYGRENKLRLRRHPILGDLWWANITLHSISYRWGKLISKMSVKFVCEESELVEKKWDYWNDEKQQFFPRRHYSFRNISYEEAMKINIEKYGKLKKLAIFGD